MLNYLHKASTNPALAIRNAATGGFVPVAPNSALGQDGSLNATTWGHLDNAAMARVNPTRLVRGRCCQATTLLCRKR